MHNLFEETWYLVKCEAEIHGSTSKGVSPPQSNFIFQNSMNYILMELCNKYGMNMWKVGKIPMVLATEIPIQNAEKD
jgi:hypothetical protein